MLASLLATRPSPPPPPPVPPIVTAWMLDLPFTNAIDLVNNQSYPMPYRIGAASVAKLVLYQALIRFGGYNHNIEWMLKMISRQQSQTPGFAAIYASAPLISGFDISGDPPVKIYYPV